MTDDGSTQDDLTGRLIASQFKVSRLLGRGGMGAVYLAEQVEMARQVVVKVMNPAVMGQQADLEERFKREARMVAQLNHPNIVQVHVFGRTEDGQMYLAMEFVKGQSLNDLLKAEGAMSEARTLRILDQICSALIEAHDLGLVHRDLKPDNIMLTERHGTQDYVKVLDFGIAKLLDSPDAKLTQTGAIFGTPQYMAPEQAKAKHVDQRTDIYALGLIAYEMLTGKLPFSADSAMDYLLKHISEPIEPPSRKFTGLVMLPRTESMILKATQKDAAQRFQSVAEMQREIRQALRDRPDAGKPFPTPQAPQSPPPGGVEALAPTALPDSAALAPTAAPVADKPAPAPPATKRSPLPIVAAVVISLGLGAAAMWGLRSDGQEQPTKPVTSNDDPQRAPDPDPVPATKLDAALAAVDTPDPGTTAKPDDPAGKPVDKPVRKPIRKPRDKPTTQVVEKDVPETDPPVDIPAAGKSIDGLPVPRGAELSSSSPQALSLRTSLAPDKVLAFYRRALGRKWGKPKDIPNGLQFTNPKSPVTYVTLARVAGGLMVNLSLNAMVEPPKPKGGKGQKIFGVPIPPGAETTVKTPTSAVFQIAKTSKEVVRFYRKRFDGVKGTTFVETMVQGAPYLVVTGESDDIPFANVAVMKTPDSLKPAPGEWTQISVTRK